MSPPRLPGTGTGRRRAARGPGEATTPASTATTRPSPSGTAEIAVDADEATPSKPSTPSTPSTAREDYRRRDRDTRPVAGNVRSGDLATPSDGLARWPHRVLATGVDLGGAVAIYLVAGLAGTALRDVGNRPAVTVLLLGYIWVVGWVVWQVLAQARTGQSVGKRVVRVRVVDATGSPTGVTRGLARLALHVLDLLPAGLGFLWPLWDARRQTFADKLTGTTVVRDQHGSRPITTRSSG